MTVEFCVLQDGVPVEGVVIKYQRENDDGENKITNAQGRVSYDINAGHTLYVMIGDKRLLGYFLRNGLNTFTV